MKDDMGDFDFLHGRWDIHNRRLKRVLSGSDVWEEFPARSEVRSLLGGMANIDEIDFPTLWSSGVTLRTYDPAAEEWSSYWVNNQTGILSPPMVGGFDDRLGVFLGEDTFRGLPVRVRFVWSATTTATPHWEQAFSVDDGATWEVNWTMDLTRAET